MSGLYFSEQFLVALFAALLALLPTVLVGFESSGPQVHFLVQNITRTMDQLLQMALKSVIEPEKPMLQPTMDPESHEIIADRSQEAVAKKLGALVDSFTACQKAYEGELTHSSTSPIALRAVVASITRLRRNPLLMPMSHIPGERIRNALERSRQAWVVHSPATLDVSEGQPEITIDGGHSRLASDATVVLDYTSPDSIEKMVTPPPREKELSFEVSPKNRNIRHFHSISSTPFGISRGFDSNDSRQALDDARESLVVQLGTTFGLCAATISSTYWGNHAKPDTDSSQRLTSARNALRAAISEFQQRLVLLLEGASIVNLVPDTPPTPALIRSASTLSFRHFAVDTYGKEHFRIAFYMIALLDLSRDAHELSSVVIELSRTAKRKRWWAPQVDFWNDPRSQERGWKHGEWAFVPQGDS